MFEKNLSEYDFNTKLPTDLDKNSLPYLNSLCSNIEQAILSFTTFFSKIIQGKKHIDREAILIKNIEWIIYRTRILGSKLLHISKDASSHFNLSTSPFKFNRASTRFINSASKLLNENFHIHFIITPNILHNTINSLNSLYNKSRNLLKKTKNDHLKTSIDRFINIRNENYKSNPGKMLDSLLNREYKRITFDKLIINDNNSLIIITDQHEIEDRTINYFQNIGKIFSDSDPSRDILSLPEFLRLKLPFKTQEFRTNFEKN